VNDKIDRDGHRRIPAIRTMYNGILMRSRQEARFAALFDLFGWSWEYEPFELNFYIPDYVLHFAKQATLVEVKGPAEDIEIAKWKIEQSGWDKEALIVHRQPGPIWGPFYCIGDMWTHESSEAAWHKAVLHRCLSCGEIMFVPDSGDWRCRQCGAGSGNAHLGDFDPREAWASASNRVQWRPES
jgi:hypothetical protein